MLIDTHAHLDFPEFDKDRDEVIKRAGLAGVEYIVNIGSSLRGSERSLELAKRYANIYAAIGIHPHEADRFDKDTGGSIRKLASGSKVVAIGEIGLDYYKNFSRRENQLSLFASLIGIAKELVLPLVIHSRNADGDTLKILKSTLPLKAVVHCFSGSEDFLKACLDLGFFVSFTCNVTYKKADDLRERLKLAPLNQLFLETDAPYLAPQQLRGRRNEPANVKILAEEVARIKGIGVDEVAAVTSANAKRFFNIA